MSDGEKWQRAKEFIEQQIEAHQRAIDTGGLGFDAMYTHAVKRDIYQTILDRAEDVPTKPQKIGTLTRHADAIGRKAGVMSEETERVKAPLAFLPDLGFNVRREVQFSSKSLQSIKYAHKSVMSGDVPLDVFERWVRVAMQSAMNEGYRLGRQESEAE